MQKKIQESEEIQKAKSMVASWAQNLIASGQKLLDAKKHEAEKYITEKQEALKKQAEQELKNQANKKIESLFQ